MTENYDNNIYNEPYCVKDGCLYETVERKGKVTMVRLCDYVPVLKSEITFDDGSERRKAFEVGAIHSNGTTMPTVTVTADEMSSMKWLIEKWGSLGSYSPANNTLGKIRHAIMSTKADVEFRTVYSQTGWRQIGERYEFLMPSADSQFTVELQGKLNAYNWSGSASSDKLFYLTAMLENGLLPQRVILPLLAVTFLSPLEHFLKAASCEPKFITALVGKTGTRKSTTAALMCSFFGNFTASTLPMSFHDTANSILSNIYAVKGTHCHLKQKKQQKLEKAKYKLQKAEYKVFKADSYKPKLSASKADIKSAKALYKSRKVRDRGNPYRRAMNKRRKQAYLQSKRELKFEQKQLKTDKRFKKKELRNQRKIKRDASAGLLVLKPVSYSVKRMRASAWQKAVNEDQDNDVLHAIDSAKRRIAEPAIEKVKKPQRLQRDQKKRDRLKDSESKSKNRLNRQENRLNEKHEKYKQKKKKRRPKNKQTKKSVSDAIRTAFKFVKNVYEKEVKKFFATLAVPVIIILLVFAFIIMIFSSIASSSGFTLGTYAAQDYDLSESEKYYTKLAYEMNEKIRKVSDPDDWKDGLADFGAKKKDLKDKPDNWYWGNSDKYPWDPVYDFDTYKLWSFLCAYYYDFDAADNGDIKYWEFDGDTEDLLEEIFNAEYQFVYWYDNKSRWEELDPYNYWGGGAADEGTYYRAEQDAYIYDGQPYKYRFKPIAYTSEIGQYRDSDGYICITDNYRVLDPNNDYALTGFYVRDHRYYAGDSRPFYMYDSDNDTFFFNAGGSSHNRSFWGWNGTDAWFLVSPTDTTIWNDSITDTCMYAYYEKYYWKTECNLYYNIKQKKTFDKVIEDKLKTLSHKTERLQYYNLLVGNEDGNTLYGNHQTLYNLLPEPSIRDYSLKREFGYEMTGWNEASDGLYQGIKVYADSGTKLKMPFSGKITDVDTDDNKITIRKDDVKYWYDGNGGTKRDTEVTIANAVLINDYEEGDSIKEGKEFAKTTAGNVNFHIYIDTDGYGWDYIDPRLVLY